MREGFRQYKNVTDEKVLQDLFERGNNNYHNRVINEVEADDNDDLSKYWKLQKFIILLYTNFFKKSMIIKISWKYNKIF